MKKIFLTLLAVLSVFGLASCDNGSKNKNKKTLITYCGWDLGNETEPTLKRELINKWNATNEKIYIEMVEPQGGYDEFINTMASAGNLPDIFLVNSVPNAVVSKQAMDITNFANADEEWKTIEGALRDSVTFSDSIYAIPSAQNYIGFFANYDLIDDEVANLGGEAASVFAPGAFSYTKFFDTIKAVRKVDVTDGSGFIGVNATGDMINWLPSSIDSTLATPEGITHYVWNGSSLDMNGSTMLSALEIIQEIGSKDGKYTFNSLSPASGEDDTREQIFGSTDEKVVFEAGKMAFIQAASYYSFSDEITFNYKFVAYPDAKVISAADYICLSKAITDPAKATAAYEVAKYLTYGADGINARYEIVNTNTNLELSGLPIVTNAELTSNWFNYVTLPGVKEVYDKVVSGDIQVIVECNKATPGYLTARFNQLTGVIIEGLRGDSEYKIGDFIWDVCGGDITLAQYRQYMNDELETLINSNIVNATGKINEVVAADLVNRLSPVVPTPEGEAAQ
jgi:multiple sugar transport system substrate-binding protein